MQGNEKVHNLSAHVLNGERLVDVLAAGDGESPAVAVVVPRQLDRHVLRGHGDDCGRLDVAHPMFRLSAFALKKSTQKVSKSNRYVFVRPVVFSL